MLLLAWLGLAHASQTDCVTKDLTWRWLSTTADSSPAGSKAGDRWAHGTKVIQDVAPGATGRLTWKADDASKVPFRTTNEGGNQIETFKWNVTLTASDGKPIAADVSDTTLQLTMHCLRTTTGVAAPPAAAKTPAAAPAKAPAAAKTPAAAEKPAAPEPAKAAPAAK